MIGPFLLFIGLFLLYIASQHKSANFLNAMGVPTIQSGVQSVEQNLGDFLKQHVWDQLTAAITNAIPFFHDTMQPADGSSSSSGSGGGGGGSPGLWNVPIIGADGTPGTIQVVSHDAAGAYQDASQGGNTPTGGPVAA